MSTADPPVLRDGAGRPYSDADALPDLPQVLEHARRLEGLAATGTARAAAGWTLTFTYRGHRFGIHTVYQAAQMLYSSPDPDCPGPLLREVVAHFEGMRLLPPTWVPPPPLGRRRLILLFLVALAVAVPLTVFLALFRKL